MWYQKKISDIIDEFHTDIEGGLTSETVEVRLSEHGTNTLPHSKEATWLNYLLRQFRSPLVYILLIAAILTTWLALQEPSHVVEEGSEPNRWVDTIVILLAVVVNISVGFWQEFRSNSILKKLKTVIRTVALVRRDGGIKEISAEQVVPGDIVVLKTGMKVPADSRVIISKKLEVDESALTGESEPVTKSPEILENIDYAIGDRSNMLHMGTIIARGEGVAVVVETGEKTELGHIATLTQQTEDEPTPLQERMGRLGTIIAFLVAIVAILIFLVGIVQDHSFEEMFVIAIAVAVSAIPEGLPAAISIALAVSAQRILGRRGVVKRLIATETLGSATVICTDKTGTLTEGKMRIKKLLVEGDEMHAREILALANEAMIESTDAGDIIRGETTDQAKMRDYLDAGGNVKTLNEKYPPCAFLPFDSNLKYIASLNASHEGSRHTLFVSGAPEILLELSDHIVSTHDKAVPLTKSRKDALIQTIEEGAGEQYRMIGIAKRSFTTLKDSDTVDLEDEATRNKFVQKLHFVGLAAMRDPIREDVRESVVQARNAGIRTVMLTGDHVLTAKAIGSELGFAHDEDSIVEGSAINKLSDEELKEHIDTYEIFARVDPEHKMRVVNALQRKGNVVAMTGDGVNDAPALNAADIGVAVDSGTDIAKAASELILLNNSFSVIVAAIEQGRIAFGNIRKVTVLLLANSFTEVILIVAALILNIPLPITAVQILWINLVADSLPNVALSFEPGEKDVMQRPPVKKGERVVDAESKAIIFIVGLVTDFILLAVFLYLYYTVEMDLPNIQTIIFATLGLSTFFYVYAIKSFRTPIWRYNLMNNKLLVGATGIGTILMIAAIHVPGIAAFLGTTPLSPFQWLFICFLGITEIILIEFVKWYFFRRKK